MTFQKTVGCLVEAIPGDKASLNPVVYAPASLAAEDLFIGSFVWSDKKGFVKAQAAQVEIPLGFVERHLGYSHYDFKKISSLHVEKMQPVTVAIKGDYYAVSATDAEKGDKVFASLADGSIKCASKGTTLDGFVESPWQVQDGAKAGKLIIISKWS